MISTDKIKEMLTVDDLIRLCVALQGFDEYYFDSQGNPIFNTILDHPQTGGNSFKLYLFKETQLFHCFTGDAATYDVFELVCRAKQCEFKDAYSFIVNFFNIDGSKQGFEDSANITSLGEWDIFQKVADYNKKNDKGLPENRIIQENLLEYFNPLVAPTEWLKDGISAEVMAAYGIRIDSALMKIVIPHRDKDGNLIGIRGRSYNPIELEEGTKYMPIFIQKQMYNHSLGRNLYGLYENKETIKRMKKILVCEGEKSVLQTASFYGLDNCFAVATCGSSLSREQISMILELGVEEVILGYDADFKGCKGAPDTVEYEEKLMKVVAPLLPYVNVSVIMDYNHLLPYKGSPTDKGKEIFEQLYDSRIKLYTENKASLKQLKKR